MPLTQPAGLANHPWFTAQSGFIGNRVYLTVSASQRQREYTTRFLDEGLGLICGLVLPNALSPSAVPASPGATEDLQQALLLHRRG